MSIHKKTKKYYLHLLRDKFYPHRYDDLGMCCLFRADVTRKKSMDWKSPLFSNGFCSHPFPLRACCNIKKKR